MKNKEVIIELIHGAEGACIAINDYRICGNKPWGGGKVVRRWKTTEADIKRGLKSKYDYDARSD